MKVINNLTNTCKEVIQNKTMVLVLSLLFFTLSATLPSAARAYILPLDFILSKMTAQTGRSIFAIEQEVVIKVGEEETKIDEVWLIEGDRNLKLRAGTQGLFKDGFKINYLYNNSKRTFIADNNKRALVMGVDFYQPMLFVRANNSFKTYLETMNIPLEVKLSRASGVVSFLLGHPSVGTLNPHVWIGQDDFVIRKIRTPSGAEIEFEEITTVSKNLTLAKQQVVRWGNAVATIKLKRINLRTKETIASFYPKALTEPSEIRFNNSSPLTAAIEDFYTRFR